MKLPKFNKGKPAPVPATETKKTHIVANAGFFKELMAPKKPPPPPPSTNKTLTTSLSVSTGGPSKLPVKPQVADSMASPVKSAPSPPATPTTPTMPVTPTTPTTPVTPTTPTIAASASIVRLSPVVAEPSTEAAPVSVPEVTAAPVIVPAVAPTPAALQAIVAAVASLTGSNPIPTEADTPATEFPAEPVKPSKPKKAVRFKAADELEMIRYFVPYNDAEEKEALISGDLWRPPPMLLLSNAERGSASTEKTVQEKREAETLSVNYIREAYIPLSPAEPDPDPLDTAAATVAAAVMGSAVPSALPTFEVHLFVYSFGMIKPIQKFQARSRLNRNYLSFQSLGDDGSFSDSNELAGVPDTDGINFKFHHSCSYNSCNPASRRSIPNRILWHDVRYSWHRVVWIRNRWIWD